MSTADPLDRLQTEVLELWGEIATACTADAEFSFPSNQQLNENLEQSLTTFIENPTEETLREMWDLLHAAKMKGNATNVLDRWEGDIEELAALVTEIRDAEAYDPAWEERYPAKKSLWEFYGRLHIDEAPIINAADIKGLEFFSLEVSSYTSGYLEFQEAFEQFEHVYKDVVGHATAGTEHAVPINLEIDQLFNVIHKSDLESITEASRPDCKALYQTIAGWKFATNEIDVDPEPISSVVTEYVEATETGSYNPELWKWDYTSYIESTVREAYDLQQLNEDTVGDVLDAFDISPAALPETSYEETTPVLTLLTANESGGTDDIWSHFKSAATHDPQPAASALAVLFSEDEHLIRRLQGFHERCREMDAELEEDQLLSLGSALLMAVSPEEYVCYDHALLQRLFGHVGGPALAEGFNPHQYWLLNAFCQRLVPRVGEQVDDTSLLYIHDLAIYLTEADAETLPDADYYWVNQTNTDEIENEYLDASVDEIWHHDLSVLESGDVTFHYFDQQIIGHSTVVEEATIHDTDDGEQYRVEVDLNRYDTPIDIEDIREPLTRDDVRREKYYPFDKNGKVHQTYLSRLTPDAAEYLLDDRGVQNYFWLSANPDIWEVDSIADGGDVFYTAYNSAGNKRRIASAFETASPGDKVLFYQSSPIKAIVAEGHIKDGLHPEPHEDHDDPVPGITIAYDRKIEEISWTQLKNVTELEDASPIENGAQGSLFELTTDEYETILALEEPAPSPGEAIDQLRTKLEPIDVTFDMPDELYFPDADALRNEIEASLNSGKHIIFTGPPGTGKTKLAKKIARQCADELQQIDDYTFTTATSEWTAFDTIGGYMPTRNREDAGSDLEFSPRLFLKCFRQEQAGIVNEWLVIDEINRSDIDKAFGQLFSVLSGDSVELPYERENEVEIRWLERTATEVDLRDICENPDIFPVTPSWRLLATMNTYDKASLYEMSYAFMRRFNFVHVGIPELTNGTGEVRTSLLRPGADTDNYATAWAAGDTELESTIDTVYKDVAVIWKIVNDYPRSIGPSIVRDIFDFVDAYDVATQPHLTQEALTAAIVGLVYPQLEGMRPDDQRKLVRAFASSESTEDGDVTPRVDQQRLQNKAEDFFDIRFADE